MALFTWWRGDPLPTLRELHGFHATESDNAHLLALLAGLELAEARRRLEGHHRPYVAYLGAEPVGYGWVAQEGAAVGELGVSFVLPPGHRYLWDFATLPAWRGRGVYPRLLQAILRAEERGAAHFWIIHAPENAASQTGMQRTGFRFVGELSFLRGGGAGLVPGSVSEHARAGATLLGVPLITATPADQSVPLAPCWCCVLEAQQQGQPAGDVACWPFAAEPQMASPNCTCIVG